MTENSTRPSVGAQGGGGARRRAAKGKRWSASSTVEWVGADRVTIERHPDPYTRPAGAVKARVHYRLDGKPKRPSFHTSTAAELDVMRTFVAELALAYHHDWLADPNGKPIAPTALPTAAEGFGAPAPAPVPLAGLLSPESAGVLDAEQLVARFRQHQRTIKKRRGGGKKERVTQRNYDCHHDFFLEHARYKAGDPRLQVLGLAAGASWVFNDPAAPVVPTDLLHLIAVRSTTNLTIRAVNERCIAKWEALARAAASGDRPVPPMPELRVEEVKSSTVQGFAQQLGALLTFAFNYGHIDTLLWTQPVKDEVPHAAATSYTTRTVPGRERVADLVAKARNSKRLVRGRDGVTCEGDGGRYAAMIWIAGRLATRPEELIAIRDSWVILDPDDPRIVLRHAEVIQPALDGQPRERTQVPLKHRDPGQVRVLRPDELDREEFIEVLGRHRRDHVDAAAGPDQHFFTTHSGAPVDLSNWNDAWWKPVRDDVFGGDSYLADMPFRRLRAAAITDWLYVRGWTTVDAADMAGHSQAILEKHYKGVIDERPASTRPREVPVTVPSSSQLAPTSMTATQIAERKAALTAQVEAAREEFERLLDAEREQLALPS